MPTDTDPARSGRGDLHGQAPGRRLHGGTLDTLLVDEPFDVVIANHKPASGLWRSTPRTILNHVRRETLKKSALKRFMVAASTALDQADELRVVFRKPLK